MAAASSTKRIGNDYNYWTAIPGGGIDLTRGKGGGISIKTNNTTSKNPILIDAALSALVLIDMQNFFLHPNLSASSFGRDLVPTQIAMVNAFRKRGIKVLWLQWGLTEHDLIHMPPSYLYNFGEAMTKPTMGEEMGALAMSDGTTIGMGRMLMRGTWNSEAWGDLLDVQKAGLEAGTDFYFDKNRTSGLWGAQTPLGMFLEQQQITTLFFGGVSTDQCVFQTLEDAAYKGYDTILVPDISATSSPAYVNDMVLYNAGERGWVTTSTEILAALS